MGLDMYLHGKKHYYSHDGDSPREDGFPLVTKTLELGYWRKHPNLHGYIVREFAEGRDKCQPIGLDEGDLLNVIKAIKEKALPETNGPFFGASDGSEDEGSIEIFEKALAWLKKPTAADKTVTYQASW